MVQKKSKYLIVYENIKQQITNGDYRIGDLLLAEPYLQKEHNVSRITVRHAVDLLIEEGYVQRIHGIGTIVLSQKKSLQLKDLLSFSEENSGYGVESQLISFEENVTASKLVSSYLNIPEGSNVTCHERLRYVDDMAIGFQRVYSPPFIPLVSDELSDPNASLYKLFEDKGFIVHNAEESIESIVADEHLASMLSVKENSPLLYVQRITKDQKDQIVEYAEFFYRGDQYRYNVNLQAP